MINFLIKNGVDILLVIVGTFALVIYMLQERRKRIDAASLIILQIDEMQDKLREISTYIAGDLLNETAFYESLPLIEENYWNKYKHYFVRNMDATSFISLNQLYNYASGVQEQQLLMKSLQKNSFYSNQTVLANIEAQLIFMGLNNFYGGATPSQIADIMDELIPSTVTEENKKSLHMFTQQMFAQNPNIDYTQFWNFYRQQNERLINIINQGALKPYSPVQIKISLDKILKEYAMLEIVGTDGYRLLKRFSKKKF